jgi:serine/threonine protein kinase
MMKNDNRSEDALFQAAINLPEGQARTAFLDQACAGDDALRKRLEALLEAHERNTSVVDVSALLPTQEGLRLNFPTEENPGQVIGRYKLLQKIGEGGMGVVYMAEQEEPVRRRVALKIIKLGMDTRQVVARFEAERQALALMDHPNIARVFDGGATEAGRPYFVMELVQGVPITTFCDKNKLPARERLKLFIQVCQAIQSAHQKAIIHRDIKPNNVLVTLHHGEPMVKVIDFGVAKATNQKLTEKTLFTNHAAMIGTPAYMSPEQAEMSSLDVDTRTDIYALGVMLYELLAGSLPFPEQRLRSLGYGEMRRVIMEEEPDRPSTRLGTLTLEQKSTVARNRGEELAVLSNLLKGDLDWIAMKCLEKDRRRRYETALDLAADLKRHLENEPVTARPPSAAYRFQKMARRNSGVFAAVAVIALVLVIGVVASTWQAMRARQAERMARNAEAAARMAQQAEQKSAEVSRLDRDRAVRAETNAVAKAQAAEAARLEARRNLYAAEINGAINAMSENNMGRAIDLMKRQIPAPGEEDLRGFEWRHLWKLCQGDENASINVGYAPALAYSPDGRLFASAGPQVTVRDSSTLAIITNLPFAALALSFSGPARILAAGSGENSVKFWNTDNWKEIMCLTNAGSPACFSPDGRWFAAAATDGFILVRFQVETNYPRPSANAAQALAIRG